MLSKTEQNIQYSIALLLSNAKRKTFEALGTTIDKSGDTIARLVIQTATTIEHLLQIAKKVFRGKKFYLLTGLTQSIESY